MSLSATIYNTDFKPLAHYFEVFDNSEFAAIETKAAEIAKSGVRCCIVWHRSGDKTQGFWGPKGAARKPHWYKKNGRPEEMQGGKRRNVYLDDESFAKAAEIGNGNVSEGIRTAILTNKPNDTEKNLSEVTEKEIGEVFAGILDDSDSELYAKKEHELEKLLVWNWQEGSGIARNAYTFFRQLALYERICRKWEEKHGGSCCVVERVRDKYLMPRINGFRQDVERHINIWRPIATAPKDGTRVLLCYQKSGLVILGNFDTEKYAKYPQPYWTNDIARAQGIRELKKNPPTFWMPAPPPMDK